MKFSPGNKVKLYPKSCKDSVKNPIWGGKYGQIVGTVYRRIPPWVYVMWENGHKGKYTEDRLGFVSEIPCTNFTVDFNLFNKGGRAFSIIVFGSSPKQVKAFCKKAFGTAHHPYDVFPFRGKTINPQRYFNTSLLFKKALI